MKILALCVLLMVGRATAFAPAIQLKGITKSAPSSMKMALEDMAGIGPETGNKAFDPLKLSELAPIDHLRATELVNGRVAMLATVGWYWPNLVGKFASDNITATKPIDALFQMDKLALVQIVGLCGIIEFAMLRHRMSESTDPFYNVSKLLPKDEAKLKEFQTKELKNGRLAMLAFAAAVSHELIPGSVPGYPFDF